jgi:anaerobic ribonucleoside-triphosphate reductase
MAENLGVKNAKWDIADGLRVNRNTYNSYMYIVEDDSLSIFDKMELHGGEIIDNLDGGSALHFNNNERLTKEQYLRILEALVKTGCNYFCENVPKTICNDCGYIHPNNSERCIKCGSTNLDKAVRVVGYLKRIKDFSQDRQHEASMRFYHAEIQ